jgi:hypothetical protein
MLRRARKTTVGKLSAFVCLCLLLGGVPSRAASATAAQTQTKKETLTNASVIELAKLGFSDAVIIEKIRQSECRFDTSLEGMKQLKTVRVSDAVIQAMLNSQSMPPTLPNSETNKGLSALLDSDGRPVPLPPDKGAYLWDGKKLALLMQSQVPSMGANVGRQIGRVVNPFLKQKIELQLIGTHAQASFDNSQPLIIVSGLGEVIPGVPAFRLLYVKQGGMRRDRRILGTYDIGGLGSISMVDNEIACEIKKAGEGIYAIRPKQPLKDGEYGLVQVTRLADVPANAKSIAAPPVWDFGVYAEGRASK